MAPSEGGSIFQCGREITREQLSEILETFINPAQYCGSCYKAANWQYIGMTTGEGLVRKGKCYRTSPKMILVKPLVKAFRSLLCSQQLKGGMEK